MKSVKESRQSISNSFDEIIDECRSVLGSELHYQAMTYSILRSTGKVPISNIGMNVKTTIKNPTTVFLKERILLKNPKFQREGIEIIPDISIYSNEINSDWRRRNYENTLKETLYCLEIKASERQNSRLSFKDLKTDILKLKAQFDETKFKHNKEIGVGILIIDVAKSNNERMTENALQKVIELSKANKVDLWYFTQDNSLEILTK